MEIRDICFLFAGFTPAVVLLMGYIIRIEKALATIGLRLTTIEKKV